MKDIVIHDSADLFREHNREYHVSHSNRHTLSLKRGGGGYEFYSISDHYDMVKTYSKFQSSILKCSRVILTFTSTSPW